MSKNIIDLIDMKRVKENENFEDGYYHILKDMIDYPDAGVYVIWSKRGPGKTYGALWAFLYLGIQAMYMKRTNDDTHLLCQFSNVEGDDENDPSPYKPINDDKGLNIKPVEIEKGYGAFYHCDQDNKPSGTPVSYLVSLNAIKKVKGMSFRGVKVMIMDEFIPLNGERVLHAEGDMLLDLYMSILRDRVKRGEPEIKLLLFANAENISCPITRAFNLIDDIYDMRAEGEHIKYLPERKVLLHHLEPDKYPTLGDDLSIAALMKGTAWYDKTFGGDFSNNDFSMIVRKKSIKRFTPVVSVKYQNRYATIYRKGARLHMCDTFAKAAPLFDLDIEADQQKFYWEYLTEFRFDVMDKQITFQKYSYYDLFRNYKNYYKV